MIKISTFDTSTDSQKVDSQKVDLDTSFQFGGGRGLGPLVGTSPISPCSVCGSPILWETPSGEIRCYCCSPPASSKDVEQKIDVLLNEDGSSYAHFHDSVWEDDDLSSNDVSNDVSNDGFFVERKIFSRIVSDSDGNGREAAYRELDELLDELWLTTE